MKLLKFLSNRIVISFILIVIQMIWVALFVHFLFIDSRTLRWLFTILSVFVTLYIINNDNDDPGYKIIWLIPILSFPVFGGLLYIVFGNKKPTKGLQEAFNNQNEAIKPYIYFNDVKDKIDDPIVKGQVNYLVNEKFPIYNNSEIKYYSLGDDAYPYLLEELSKAKHFIFMEYFIIQQGKVWDSVLNILERKAKEGVEVRVMYDGLCSLTKLPVGYYKKLRQMGIKSKTFAPARPFFTTEQNNRDHRKILVIDGKVAFTGGINLADEYMNLVEKFGYWKDTAVMLKGDAVKSYTLLFLQMWNVTERTIGNFDRYLDIKIPKIYDDNGYVIGYGDEPVGKERVGESVYLHMINAANRYLHIVTPYLILDNVMMSALKFAAKRGVDVKIVMPGIPDKPYAYCIARTYYSELIEAGVEIYEYTPGFTHAKMFISDDEKATVGTINLDYRSLYLHFENGCFIYKNNVIYDIEADYENMLAVSKKVSLIECRNRPLWYKVCGKLLRLISPLM